MTEPQPYRTRLSNCLLHPIFQMRLSFSHLGIRSRNFLESKHSVHSLRKNLNSINYWNSGRLMVAILGKRFLALCQKKAGVLR